MHISTQVKTGLTQLSTPKTPNRLNFKHLHSDIITQTPPSVSKNVSPLEQRDTKTNASSRHEEIRHAFTDDLCVRRRHVRFIKSNINDEIKSTCVLNLLVIVQ